MFFKSKKKLKIEELTMKINFIREIEKEMLKEYVDGEPFHDGVYQLDLQLIKIIKELDSLC